MFGMFMEKGIIDYDYETNKTKWKSEERNIRLGYFHNRLGVDG